jgi:hypothetical protein
MQARQGAAINGNERSECKPGRAQPQDAKRKRDRAQPQDAKRKRDSAQPQETTQPQAPALERVNESNMSVSSSPLLEEGSPSASKVRKSEGRGGRLRKHVV